MTDTTDKAVVLVVDDTPDNLKVISTMLTDAGYRVLSKRDGASALELVDKKPPDIILLDVMMPGMNGFEVCARLKGDERTRRIPVVIMTALDSKDDRVKGIEAGADDFLTKPVHGPELMARVKTAIKGKREVDAHISALEQQKAALEVRLSDWADAYDAIHRTPADPNGVRACPLCCSVYNTDIANCSLDGTKLVMMERDPLIGRTIDRYHIIDRVGAGAMGCVYLATHTKLKKQFALKVLFGELASQRNMAGRFRREAQAAAELEHPNIATVTDFGTTSDGLTYMVMAFLSGPTLHDAIREGAPFSIERTVSIARQIASGLGHAHAQGFVHRDVKPGNVMLVPHDEGELAKLLDFGLVASLDRSEESTKLTQDGHTLGTPAYMAPEQAQTPAVGATADVYALGVMMYQMATGNMPFAGGPVEILVQKVMKAPPRLAGDMVLAPLVAQMMATDPGQRPPSGRDVVRMLEALPAATGTDASPHQTAEAPTTATPKLEPQAAANSGQSPRAEPPGPPAAEAIAPSADVGVSPSSATQIASTRYLVIAGLLLVVVAALGWAWSFLD